MSRRRAPGLALSSILLSFVASLLVGVAPAHATEVDKTIGYRCSSAYGSGASGVRIQVTIPDRVTRGATVPSRKVTFRIKVPADMVSVLRTYGVQSVSAEGRASYTIGTLRRPIRNLRMPETDVPDSGGMTLKGSGTAAAFTLDELGTFKVKVTKRLRATATAHGGIGDGQSVDLACAVRKGQSRTLASLTVVR